MEEEAYAQAKEEKEEDEGKIQVDHQLHSTVPGSGQDHVFLFIVVN